MVFDKILALGILAGVVQFGGYVTYTYYVYRSGVRPNPALWLIWSYGNALVCLSYIFLNQRFSLAVEFLPAVCAVTCIIVAIYFCFIGKFRPINSFEKKFIALDVIVVIIWVLSEFFGIGLISEKALHIILLLSAFFAFIPIYKDVFLDPSVEDHKAWFIWTAAYLLLLVVAILKNGNIYTILYPILYAVLHVVVGVLAKRKLL